MAFRVRTSPKAKRDLDAILRWLMAQEAGETGLQWFEGMRSAVASLNRNPRRCAIAPENNALPFEVRHLLYGNKPNVYRILFTLDEDVVTILHIRHGRRLPLTQP